MSTLSSTTNSPLLASIWAQDRAGVLGDGAGMLWHVPADFQHFKELTSGCPIIMGRASFEALGQPLPNRTNIVITRSTVYAPEGVIIVHSIPDAIAAGREIAQDMNAPYVWITGGGQVYQETVDMVDELVVTDLDLLLPTGQTKRVTAPNIDPELWEVDPTRSDADWRPQSGDARWKVTTYVRR